MLALRIRVSTRDEACPRGSRARACFGPRRVRSGGPAAEVRLRKCRLYIVDVADTIADGLGDKGHVGSVMDHQRAQQRNRGTTARVEFAQVVPCRLT